MGAQSSQPGQGYPVASLCESSARSPSTRLAPPESIDWRARSTPVRILRTLLDRRTFRLTDSELERLFLPIARAAVLPPPHTRSRVNGFRVDFFWPELGLVVETDGLRYHRTPAEQAADRRRDQTHTAAGLTPLRFTHAQVKFEPEHVERTLREVARRPATGSERRS